MTATIFWWVLPACYTRKIVIRGFFGTLLLALGLWGFSHVFLLAQGMPASCQSACTCGCCMHGGMCPMMAAKARMERASRNVSGANQSQSGVSCSCLVSSPLSPIVPVSHADLLFTLPRLNLPFELPLANQRAGRNIAYLAAPAGRLPDPPPKAFSSV